MIKRLLIANRGEIAARIIRTCDKLGIIPVVIYSEADKALPYVKTAQESYPLGASEPEHSYLSISKILQIASQASCDAVHPGYGFLSESATFAEQVEKLGKIFIGPRPETLKNLGEKNEARKIAQSLGIPTPEGYNGEDQSLEKLTEEATRIGTPLLIKSSAAGGGRGMRRIDNLLDFPDSVKHSKREAKAAFGNDHLILEKLISPARHIEVQLLGDGMGEVIHLYERDCSAQRRYQKIIEEAPALGLPSSTRQAILKDALLIGRTSKLRSAATVEFLVSETSDSYYFLEVNPRLQVEHPVTEMITGLDIIELQLRIANNLGLGLRQDDIHVNGVAVEVRICGEIPERSFLPSTGVVSTLLLPQTEDSRKSLRIEHALESGVEVSSYYDSMLAKIICSASTHSQARAGISQAINDFVTGGIDTNSYLLLNLLETLDSPEFGKHFFNTDDVPVFISRWSPETRLALLGKVACLFTCALEMFSRDPRNTFKNFSISQSLRQIEKYKPNWNLQISSQSFPESISETSLLRDNRIFHLAIRSVLPSSTNRLIFNFEFDNQMIETEILFNMNGVPRSLRLDGEIFEPRVISLRRDFANRPQVNLALAGIQFNVSPAVSISVGPESKSLSSGELKAPLPGTVVKLNCKKGDIVSTGQVLVVIESMKMEHALRTTTAGMVAEVLTNLNSAVAKGQTLVRITQN